MLQELLDYEMMFALWLCIGRVELRRSVSVLTAIASAVTGSVPKEMFAALAEDPEQGNAMHEMYLAEKRAAELQAEMREDMQREL